MGCIRWVIVLVIRSRSSIFDHQCLSSDFLKTSVFADIREHFIHVFNLLFMNYI